MITWKEAKAKSETLFDEVKTILSNPEADAEQKAKVEPMLKEAEEYKQRAFDLRKVDEAKANLVALKEDEQAAEIKSEQKQIDTKREFKDWAEYLQAAHNGMNPQYRGPIDPRLVKFKDEKPAGMEQKADVQVESTGALGGFLVPSEFRATLYAAMGENTIVRSRASIIRMARRQIDIPVLDQTNSTAGVPAWFGGMQFYWTEEAAAKDLTNANFRQVSLVAHKLVGYTRASDELLDDSAISLSDFLSGPMGFAGGVAWYEDYAFLRGTGAGQPLGILNAGATLTVARQADDPVIQYEDLVNMLEAFLPTGRGVWIINQSAMSNLLTMQDNAGGAGTGTYIWGSTTDGVPNRLLGFPVIFTEKTPTVGNAGDVILADMSYYLVGDRQATTIESTQYDYWRYDQTSWRVVHRVDGQPWLSAPLYLQDGTTQISPFVILGAKSS